MNFLKFHSSLFFMLPLSFQQQQRNLRIFNFPSFRDLSIDHHFLPNISVYINKARERERMGVLRNFSSLNWTFSLSLLSLFLIHLLAKWNLVELCGGVKLWILQYLFHNEWELMVENFQIILDSPFSLSLSLLPVNVLLLFLLLHKMNLLLNILIFSTAAFSPSLCSAVSLHLCTYIQFAWVRVGNEEILMLFFLLFFLWGIHKQES